MENIEKTKLNAIERGVYLLKNGTALYRGSGYVLQRLKMEYPTIEEWEGVLEAIIEDVIEVQKMTISVLLEIYARFYNSYYAECYFSLEGSRDIDLSREATLRIIENEIRRRCK